MNQEPPFLPSYDQPSALSGIDWSFVNSCDPQILYQTKDFKALQQFISSFMNSKLNCNDKCILSHPLSYKIIELLQITIQYMFECQKQLTSEVEELQDKNELFKQKIKLLVKAQNRSNLLLRDAYHDFEKCPICAKKFKAIKYVDNHIKQRHPEHQLAWKSLRINNPINPSQRIKELEDEILYLKQMLNQQNKQFMDSMLNMRKQMDAKMKDAKRQQKTTPTIEYIEVDPKSKDDKVSYPPVIDDNYKHNKFKQSVVHVEMSTKQDKYENMDDAANKLHKKAQKKSEEIHLGLGANYITPKQVEGILKYNNPAYRRFYDSAKAQLEKDFPMPDPSEIRRKKLTSFYAPNPTKSSSSVTQSSILAAVSSDNTTLNTSKSKQQKNSDDNQTKNDKKDQMSVGEVVDLTSDSDYNDNESDTF